MLTPGVYVTTSVRSGVAGTVRALSGQYFMASMFERGPVNVPVKVNSMADVNRLFGGRVAYSDGYDHLTTFFAEGGRQAQVVRVVGTDATTGELVLKDRAEPSLDTLRITASSPGAWSAGISVQVRNGAVANTFRITVRLNGVVVEDYNSITTPADAVSRTSTSSYIRVASVGSVTVAPGNNPAVIDATPLSGGDDQRSSVTDASYVAAIAHFDASLGDGSIAIPGQTGTTIHNALVEHAKANNRVAILAAQRTAASDDLRTVAAAVTSEYAGLFAPWVKVPTAANATRTISPESYVAAVRARAHEQVGPWRKPAGNLALAQYVVDVDTVYSQNDYESLYSARVNLIRLSGTAIRLYGWRSLSIDEENWADLKDRDLLNRLTVAATKLLEDYVFETIDSKGHLVTAIKSALVGLVDPISQADGLYARYDSAGEQIDPGYSVTVEVGNGSNGAARNEILATLAVRVAPAGDLVTLNIVKVSLEGAL